MNRVADRSTAWLRTGTALPVLLLALVASLPAAADETATTTHHIVSEHYDLYYEGTRAEAMDASAVLEAAYVGFKRYFRGTPRIRRGEKLKVRFFADRARFARAIRADGTEPPQGGAGGYYWMPTRTAYLFRQPTRYFTRVLLVHEAAHQFHFLTRTRNMMPAGPWYAEGVAEYLSWHHWDGKQIRLAQIPVMSLKDYPRQALEILKRSDFDFEAFALGRLPPHRALTWAIYSFLASGARDGRAVRGFTKFSRAMDGRQNPASSFISSFGKPERYRQFLIEWLEQNQCPWEQVFNEWEGQGQQRYLGHAEGVVSICRPRTNAKYFKAELVVPDERPWRAGVVLGFDSNADYAVAMVTNRRRFYVDRRNLGRWERLRRGRAPPPREDGTYLFEIKRRGRNSHLFINGQDYGQFIVEGQAGGLALENCEVRFQKVDLQAIEE